MAHLRRDDCTSLSNAREELALGATLRCGNKVYTIRRAIRIASGVTVFAAYSRHELEEDDNIKACEVLTRELGWTCVLLPRSDVCGEKTADVLNANDGTLWEIKTNHSGNPQSISKALQKASKQAQNAIVRIVAQNFNMNAIEEAAKRRKTLTELKEIVFIVNGKISFLRR